MIEELRTHLSNGLWHASERRERRLRVRVEYRRVGKQRRELRKSGKSGVFPSKVDRSGAEVFINEKRRWPGVLQYLYEWWKPAVVFLLALAATGFDTPWHDLGIATLGGLAVLILTGPVTRARQASTDDQLWKAADWTAAQVGRDIGAAANEILDSLPPHDEPPY